MYRMYYQMKVSHYVHEYHANETRLNPQRRSVTARFVTHYSLHRTVALLFCIFHLIPLSQPWAQTELVFDEYSSTRGLEANDPDAS